MRVRIVMVSVLAVLVLGLALAAMLGHLSGYVPLVGIGVVLLMIARRRVRMPWDRKPN